MIICSPTESWGIQLSMVWEPLHCCQHQERFYGASHLSTLKIPILSQSTVLYYSNRLSATSVCHSHFLSVYNSSNKPTPAHFQSDRCTVWSSEMSSRSAVKRPCSKYKGPSLSYFSLSPVHCLQRRRQPHGELTMMLVLRYSLWQL